MLLLKTYHLAECVHPDLCALVVKYDVQAILPPIIERRKLQEWLEAEEGDEGEQLADTYDAVHIMSLVAEMESLQKTQEASCPSLPRSVVLRPFPL